METDEIFHFTLFLSQPVQRVDTSAISLEHTSVREFVSLHTRNTRARKRERFSSPYLKKKIIYSRAT